MRSSDPQIRSAASHARWVGDGAGAGVRSRSSADAGGPPAGLPAAETQVSESGRPVPPGWVRRGVGSASHHIRQHACLFLPRICVPMWGAARSRFVRSPQLGLSVGGKGSSLHVVGTS